MNITFDIDYSQFVKDCKATVEGVRTGSEKEVRRAIDTIGRNSQAQVPRATETLANSMYKEIYGDGKIFEGVIGYGGPADTLNPVTNRMASEYMVKVHEDTSVFHPNGKAKFLEDPVNAYQDTFFGRVIGFMNRVIGKRF